MSSYFHSAFLKVSTLSQQLYYPSLYLLILTVPTQHYHKPHSLPFFHHHLYRNYLQYLIFFNQPLLTDLYHCILQQQILLETNTLPHHELYPLLLIKISYQQFILLIIQLQKLPIQLIKP